MQGAILKCFYFLLCSRKNSVHQVEGGLYGGKYSWSFLQLWFPERMLQYARWGEFFCVQLEGYSMVGKESQCQHKAILNYALKTFDP